MKADAYFPQCRVPIHLPDFGDTKEDETDFLPYVILYKGTFLRSLYFWLFSILTAGVGFLLMHWFLNIYILVTYSRCTSLEEADHVYVVSESKKMRKLVRLKHASLPEAEVYLAMGQTGSHPPSYYTNPQNQKYITTYLYEHICARYIYHPIMKEFHRVQYEFEAATSALLENNEKGVKSQEILEARKFIYGPGCIEVPIPPLYELLVNEIMKPIYIYQLAALALWYSDQYYSYASAILFITVLSLGEEIYEIRKNEKRFREIARHEEIQHILIPKSSLSAYDSASVVSEPKHAQYKHTHCIIKKMSKDIVPGDIVEIGYGIVPCDLILLTGSALMNESMLSGESAPKLKSSLESFPSDYVISSKISRNHYQSLKYVLYGGTEVVQIKSEAEKKPLGLVIRTAFSTAQGQMLAVLFDPTAVTRNQFIRETYKFLLVLSIIATIGAFSSIWMTMSYHLQASVVIIRFLDTFTNLIAPVLPASMTVGCSFAVDRLKRFRKVLCLQSSSVLVSGQVNTMIFDKTGTLTEESVTVDGFLVTNTAMQISSKIFAEKFDPVTQSDAHRQPLQIPDMLTVRKASDSFSECSFMAYSKTVEKLPTIMTNAIACCHDLIYWKNTIVGDLLEVQLFNLSNWQFIEHPRVKDVPGLQGVKYQTEIRIPQSSTVLYILRRFEFKPELQRMSVVVYNQELDKCFTFCKGSPEQVELRSDSETLPETYGKVLHSHSKAGKRILAYGYKEIPKSKVTESICENSRDMVECDLLFLGFVLFMNQLKSDTIEVVQSLKEAGVHCKMATGDNPLTALAIANECKLISSDKNGLFVLGLLQSGMTVTPKDGPSTLGSESTSAITSLDSSTNGSDTTTINQAVTLVWKKVNFSSKDATDHCSVSLRKHVHSLPYRKTEDKGQACAKWPTDGVAKNMLNDHGFEGVPEIQRIYSDSLLQTAASTPLIGLGANPLHDQFIMPNQPGADKVTKTYYNSFVSMVDCKANEDTLTTQELISLINNADSLDRHVEIALTGPALRYLSTTCNATSDYNLRLQGTNQFSTAYTESINSQSPSLVNRVLDITSNGGESKKNQIRQSSDRTTMSFFEYCLRTCLIFARMTPQDKAFLIRQMRALKGSPLIGMCGDGANDCEALKVSDIGVSLSGEVTSICAHVTSLDKSIRSSYSVLCEGRGALVNGFASCIYIILYALVQFTSVMILYWFGGNLTDEEYMYVDLFIILPLVVSAAWTHGADKLTRQLPLHRLIGPSVLTSIVGHYLIQFAFMMISLFFVMKSDFYVPFQPNPEAHRFESEDLECFENSVVFLTSAWQYIILNALLQKGRPWRKSRFTNWWYLISFVSTSLLVTFLFFAQDVAPAFQAWMGLVNLPMKFRAILLAISACNFLVSLFFERFVTRLVTFWEIRKNRALYVVDHPKYFTSR